MTAGRKVGDTTTDGRRAILGVMLWIAILLAGYWLVAEWRALPALAASWLTTAANAAHLVR